MFAQLGAFPNIFRLFYRFFTTQKDPRETRGSFEVYGIALGLKQAKELRRLVVRLFRYYFSKAFTTSHPLVIGQ